MKFWASQAGLHKSTIGMISSYPGFWNKAKLFAIPWVFCNITLEAHAGGFFPFHFKFSKPNSSSEVAYVRRYNCRIWSIKKPQTYFSRLLFIMSLIVCISPASQHVKVFYHLGDTSAIPNCGENTQVLAEYIFISVELYLEDLQDSKL